MLHPIDLQPFQESSTCGLQLPLFDDMRDHDLVMSKLLLKLPEEYPKEVGVGISGCDLILIFHSNLIFIPLYELLLAH